MLLCMETKRYIFCNIVLHNMICERYVNDVMGDTQQMITSKWMSSVSIESYIIMSVFIQCSCIPSFSPLSLPTSHIFSTSTINENDGGDYETLLFLKISRSVAFNEETRFQHVRVNK